MSLLLGIVLVRGNISLVKARRRQHGRTLMSLRHLLHFNLGKEHGWSIRFSAFRGVPMMSTPRTSSSGRPSGYTFHTISGITWKACGMLRMVSVKPPAISSQYNPNGFPCFLISSISFW